MLSNVILEQLSDCKTFTFQIAFISGGGIALLKSKLRDLKNKGIEGRLLTSTYLDFNRPNTVFGELLKIEKPRGENYRPSKVSTSKDICLNLKIINQQS